jgi:hypothetical protein
MTEAERLCANVPEPLRRHAVELVTNVLFLEDRLRTDRDTLSKMASVIPYDNGGGQTGFRRNPLAIQYNANLKAYTSALNALTSILGDNIPSDARPTLDRFKVIKGARAVGDD